MSLAQGPSHISQKGGSAKLLQVILDIAAVVDGRTSADYAAQQSDPKFGRSALFHARKIRTVHFDNKGNRKARSRDRQRRSRS